MVNLLVSKGTNLVGRDFRQRDGFSIKGRKFHLVAFSRPCLLNASTKILHSSRRNPNRRKNDRLAADDRVPKAQEVVFDFATRDD